LIAVVQMIAVAEQVEAEVQVAAPGTDGQRIAIADDVSRPIEVPPCRRDDIAVAVTEYVARSARSFFRDYTIQEGSCLSLSAPA
jgi:hypothetical protein